MNHAFIRSAALLFVCLCASAMAGEPGDGPFPAMNTIFRSNIPLSGFTGAPGNAAGCWGYTSPSGREYALVGLSNSLAVVEVTNPSTPVIVGQITHSESLWCEVATYGTYAYVSNETGGGIDVINLAQVDSGVVTLVQRLTANGLSTTHTVRTDEVGGYLYLNGSNLGGGRLLALSLANPANPVIVGQVPSSQGTYCHDSQIVTYTSGPYAGKQIAFCCNGGGGFDIVDVTNKSNMVRLAHSSYPNLSYCHQGWLSEDRKYFYINDETDGVNETVIFNVENLSAPALVGSYNSGVSATDHNLYVRGQFIYEAEYRAGLRVFCAANPEQPVQVGWLDSYPENDNSGYQGAWNVYPFFPSGNVIISDINRGMFVVDPTPALSIGTLAFDYPNQRPDLVDPNGGTPLQVAVSGQCGAVVQPGSAKFHYNIGNGFVEAPMTEIAPNQYQAVFPAAECSAEVHYYISAQTASGQTIVDPAGAPASTYHAVAADSVNDLFSDNFETNLGWTTEILGATAGQWQRGVPVNDPAWEYDPAEDADGSGQCWLTQNTLGNSDVDNGAVRLTSPTLDLTAGNLSLAYSYYLRLTNVDGIDKLLVEISSNGLAGPWTVIASHTTNSGQSELDHLDSFWDHVHISDAQLASLGVTLTSNMRVRFTANDGGTQSIVEAGVDAFEIHQFICGSPCSPADVNCDGSVNVIDLLAVINGWGACPAPPAPCAADVAPNGGDGTVNVLDLLFVINNWG